MSVSPKRVKRTNKETERLKRLTGEKGRRTGGI